MKNKVFYIIVIPIIIIFTNFCINLLQPSTTYLSITSTDTNFNNYYFSYNIKTNEKIEILKNIDTAQYPLSYLDKASDILYYVRNDGDGDQIYSYNTKSKVEKMITSTLYAVNEMFVYKDNIYAAAMIKGQKNISLITINIEDSKLEVISESNLNIESISLKKSSNIIYFVGYNMNEQLQLINEYEKNNDGSQLKNATSKLFVYNIVNEEVSLKYKSEDMITQVSVMSTQDKMIIKLSDDVFTSYKFYWFDLMKNQIIDEITFNDVVRIDDMEFSNDDSYLYFLGVEKINSYNQNDASQIAPSNHMYKYDVKTAEIKEILTLKDKYMNNFEIIKN